MHNLSIRLGRFEFYAQPETAPATFRVTRRIPGEVIVDMPGVSIFHTNGTRTEAHTRQVERRQLGYTRMGIAEGASVGAHKG
jgi:hypothetical protein